MIVAFLVFFSTAFIFMTTAQFPHHIKHFRGSISPNTPTFAYSTTYNNSKNNTSPILQNSSATTSSTTVSPIPKSPISVSASMSPTLLRPTPFVSPINSSNISKNFTSFSLNSSNTSFSGSVNGSVNFKNHTNSSFSKVNSTFLRANATIQATHLPKKNYSHTDL